MAKVNAIDEQELAEEFDVRSFPTLKLFVNGDRKQSVDYTGQYIHADINVCLRESTVS